MKNLKLKNVLSRLATGFVLFGCCVIASPASQARSCRQRIRNFLESFFFERNQPIYIPRSVPKVLRWTTVTPDDLTRTELKELIDFLRDPRIQRNQIFETEVNLAVVDMKGLSHRVRQRNRLMDLRIKGLRILQARDAGLAYEMANASLNDMRPLSGVTDKLEDFVLAAAEKRHSAEGTEEWLTPRLQAFAQGASDPGRCGTCDDHGFSRLRVYLRLEHLLPADKQLTDEKEEFLFEGFFNDASTMILPDASATSVLRLPSTEVRRSIGRAKTAASFFTREGRPTLAQHFHERETAYRQLLKKIKDRIAEGAVFSQSIDSDGVWDQAEDYYGNGGFDVFSDFDPAKDAKHVADIPLGHFPNYVQYAKALQIPLSHLTQEQRQLIAKYRFILLTDEIRRRFIWQGIPSDKIDLLVKAGLLREIK